MGQRGLVANISCKEGLGAGVGGKVNGTCRERTENGGAEAAVEAAKAVCLSDSATDRSDGATCATGAGGLHAGA